MSAQRHTPLRDTGVATVATAAAIDAAQHAQDIEPQPPEQLTPARRQLARSRYAVLTASHAFVDTFPILFVVLNLNLTQKLDLTAFQVNVVYALTPIFSGTLQPVFAYLSDRLNTRIFSPLGLALGALCVGSIGFAQSFEQLITLQIIGVIGIGFYHPVSTALAGQTGARAFTSGRAFAVGIFIAAGMVGQSLSSYLTPRLVEATSMQVLVWYIPPALLMALVLHLVIRHIPHRSDHHHNVKDLVPPRERMLRWFVVANLTIQNCLRFIVNIGVFVMFNVWAASKLLPANLADMTGTERDAALAFANQNGGKISGTIIAAVTVGMGVSVILSGRLIKRGHERLWLATLSIAGALVVATLGFVGDTVLPERFYATPPGFVDLLPLAVFAALAPIGFFSTFPIAASLGQRLQPAHTSLVMSLLMGVGWSVSASAPYLAWFFMGAPVKDAPTLDPAAINTAFIFFSLLLLAAGVLAATMPKRVIASVADDH